MAWDLVIFDNDGVLVDSETLANTVLATLLSEVWGPTTLEECIARYMGGSIERVRTLLESDSTRRLPPDFEAVYYARAFAAFDAGLTATPGVADVIDQLAADATPFCVASSGSHERIRRTLSLVGLWSRFDGRVFSAADVSRGKPAPDLFLYAARTLGADPSSTVVVEDSPLGVQAAKAAGIYAIGYCALTPAGRLEQADVLAPSMADVGEALRKLAG